MTNPTAALRIIIVYLVCITLAVAVGYMLTDPLDYGTLFIFCLIAAILASPFIIKWYYPILLFGLGSPIYCFFFPGDPPLSQVVVLLCLGIAIINRAINSERTFISAPIMTWALLYTIAMVVCTAELTGGAGLHQLGGEVGGGKKYITLLIGVLSYFALVSYRIPRNKLTFYLALYFLPGTLSFVSDLFPYLPKPLNYINLLMPPSVGAGDEGPVLRLGALAGTAGAIMNFMTAKYGLRGIFRIENPFRFLIFFVAGVLSLFGGFRIILVNFALLFFLVFFFEGLHRTRMVMVFTLLGFFSVAVLFAASDKLPLGVQRSLTVVPFLKLDPIAVADADESKRWREDMWRDVWPKVPQYLFLGKGYALTAEDFQAMGTGTFAEGGLDKDASGLAVSMDYHNGPLSTLMPFGIWGMISFLWIATASLWITYRNMKYGDPSLQLVNNMLFAGAIVHVVNYFFLFGAYVNDVGGFMQVVGFSVALNWGVSKPKPQPVREIVAKPIYLARRFGESFTR